MTSRITAVSHIRPMGGRNQAHLLRCSDDEDYVVTFPNNPRGTRSLASDYLGTLLAIQLGLPAQEPNVIDVPESLIERSPQLMIELDNRSFPCEAGKSFGYRYPSENASPLIAIDLWADAESPALDLSYCAGIFAFDQWTCNTGVRELLFHQDSRPHSWRISMVNQGACFDGQRWGFPDALLRGLYKGVAHYLNVGRNDSFEIWLDRLERAIDRATILEAASSVPGDWYGKNKAALLTLTQTLDERRRRMRTKLYALVESLQTNVPVNLSLSAASEMSKFWVPINGTRVMAIRRPRKAEVAKRYS